MSGPFSNKGPLGGAQLTAAELLWTQTGNAGVILLGNQASVPATTAGVGKIYTLTSDGHLYYKDGSGTIKDLIVSSGGFTELVATGACNSSNQVFTFTQVPSYMVADGILLKAVGKSGMVMWTNVGTTITMVNPPSFDIFGIA